MELKKTQIAVLKVLAKHKDEWMGVRDIQKESGVHITHIKQAIIFFMDNDLVYQPDSEDKVKISGDGLAIVSEYM